MKKTVENLMAAFIGESQARNRYETFAKIAKKEGFVLVSNVFQETANQERVHGSYFYEMLQKLKKDEPFEDLELKSGGPTTYDTTAENLKSAIIGENHEWEELYPDIADTAEKEGYPDIATRVKAIARAEKHHSERYGKLLKLVGDDVFFKRGEQIVWVCIECGYEMQLDELPKSRKCPSCDHPRSYFRKKSEDF
jgi:rubrerythrin